MKLPPPFLLLLHFFFFLQTINGDHPADSTDSHMPNSPDSVSNFQPSLAVVIGMLAIMFSLTFVLLLYAKFCHHASVAHASATASAYQIDAAAAATGLDKTVVESLPFFRFSSLKGSRGGLDCAVCLARFEDVEILRLLPKCKHAFHIACVDQWLEKHATCPLCRRRVSSDDLSLCSPSLRFLWNPTPELRPDSGDHELELFVERAESHRGSSRFCIGSSFRRISGGSEKEEELPIPMSMDCSSPAAALHRFNHRIVVSDVVVKNRWSNVSSSDIMFLNSEMLSETSSARFSPSLMAAAEVMVRENSTMSVKEEIERKRAFESKLKEIKRADHNHDHDKERKNLGFEYSNTSSQLNNPNSEIKRSMSEIVVHPRFRDQLRNNASLEEINVKEDRRRRLWIPIARKTVHWFANRERRRRRSSQSSHKGLNV